MAEPTNLSESSITILEGQLAQFGMEGLLDPLIEFLESEGYEQVGAEVLLGWLEEQPIFKERFPALKWMRDKKMPVSVQKILDYEDQVNSVLRRWGVDPTAYSNYQKQILLAQGVSAAEVNDRMEEGYRRVAEAPPEVRAAFRTYFGDADTALATFFLNGNASAESLLQQAEQAEILGRSIKSGFSAINMESVRRLTGDSAERYSMEEVDDAINRMERLRSLTTRVIGEGSAGGRVPWQPAEERISVGFEPEVEQAFGPGATMKWTNLGSSGAWTIYDADGNIINPNSPAQKRVIDRWNDESQSERSAGYRLEMGRNGWEYVRDTASSQLNRQEMLQAAAFGDGDAQREIDRILSTRKNALSGSAGTLIEREGSSVGSAE